ncbi:speckle-type POZ protein-like isoform X2 [Pecten maximus]|uniref:speckle-type POZ protein-like isoform X2 n=1 Tax=Pecten maximus TaxID=6579 RepID=UPI0014589927|nr:speckle-type POZ protein-like isoform X2 [Pecten maximus]
MAAKCSGNDPSDIDKTELWVSRVNAFSSEYDGVNWSANCVIGPPRVYPRYGDIRGAWAQGVCDSNQFLEVGFEHKLYLEEIHIYETYHAGSVRCVKARGPDKSWVVIWTGKTQDLSKSRIFKPDIVKTKFQTNELRVETDCSTSGTWAEIDAIQIVGRKYDFAMPLPEGTLSDALEKLVNNWKFSDVQFKVEKETFYAHKAIMLVRSDFFDAIFTRDFKEKNSKEPIVFQDISAESFKAMLHFIYTNKIPPNSSCLLLTDLWRVADRFKLNGLQALTVREIASKLDVNNVVDIYMAAIFKLPVIDNLDQVCLSYMSKNIAEVVNTSSFMKLPLEQINCILNYSTSQVRI